MIEGALSFEIQGETLLLLCQKAIYWQQQSTLLVADVHLGKGGHFRKAGIAIPPELAQADLVVLSDLIRVLQPTHLVFLGDLFHSDLNNDWDWFVLWRAQFPKLEITLVLGNHDVITPGLYTANNIGVCTSMFVAPFLLLHHPLPSAELEKANGYVLCGHVHPGVYIKGKARQSVTLPCFVFNNRQGILPSFGRFTGKVALAYAPGDAVFGVLNDSVIGLQ